MSWHVAALTMTTIAAALPAVDLFAQQKPASILVHEVTSVDCTLEKSNPPNTLVKSKGMVTTGGHANPRLVQVLYVLPPADGIQDLEFYVDPPAPGTVVTQVLTELETPILRIEHVPSWMKGVRVRAATNKIEKLCS
jgi:hypothetical protein